VSVAPIDSSASYAAEVARLLWPEPWATPYVTRRRRSRGLPHRDAYVFPSEGRPRMLVPVDVPGAATMLRRLGSGRSRFTAPARALLERSVRSSAFSHTRWPVLRVIGPHPDADSIERHLGDCFGTDVRVGVLLGTRRVNQKPVLQVFDLDGGLLGYAKIGHNDLTAGLVRAEAAALAAVGGRNPRSFRIPEVLGHGRWAGLEVLVMSDLTTDPREAVTPAARAAAMCEVSSLLGTREQALGDSGFWARLRVESLRLVAETNGRRLGAAADAIDRAHRGDVLRLGGWHGDWGHWNMGMGDGVLKVWDWERFDAEVPLGFDALHHAAQRVRPGEREAQRQEATFLRSVPETLAEVGVPPDRHGITLRLYLMEIALRYVEALTHGATPALSRRTEWTISLLERQLGSTRIQLVGGRS
jgi:hypothetical protein